MRVAAYALVALALGAGEAAAQCYGPECDSRSGPTRQYYYTEPSPGPGPGFERPQYRAPEPGFDGPQYRAAPDDRIRREYRSEDMPPPRPPASRPAEPRPESFQERSTRAPEIRRDVWGDRVPPSSPPRDTQRRPGNAKPPASGTVTISIAEYEDLRNRARELQRLLGERRDFHDVPSQSGPRPNTIYR